MKRIITIIMMMLLITTFASATFSYIDGKSIMLISVKPLKEETSTASNNYRAIFDLNYVNAYDLPNIYGDPNITWFIYPYRVWFSSSGLQHPGDYVYWEIQPSTPCDYNPYNTCPEFNLNQTLDPSYIQQNNLNFISLPYVLASCTFDCNYTGNPATCNDDHTGTQGVDKFTIDYNGYYKWNCVQGETPYKCEGYTISDVFGLNPPAPFERFAATKSNNYAGDVPNFMKLDTQIREDRVFTCPKNSGKVRWSCTIRPDWRSRRQNITDAPYDAKLNPDGWTFNNIFSSLKPSIVTYLTDKDYELDRCFKINNSNASFEGYNVTIEQALSSAGIKYTGGEVITLSDFDKIVIGKQRLINQKKQDLMNKNSFQLQILNFVDVVSNMFILIWYIVVAALLSGLMFRQIPDFFTRVINIFKEFTRLKKY